MAYSVSDIKQIHEQNGGYFFTRDTLKFFGETMKSFGVRNLEEEVYLYRRGGKAGDKVWQFIPDSGDLRPTQLKPKDIGVY